MITYPQESGAGKLNEILRTLANRCLRVIFLLVLGDVLWHGNGIHLHSRYPGIYMTNNKQDIGCPRCDLSFENNMCCNNKSFMIFIKTQSKLEWWTMFCCERFMFRHDDVTEWKHFPRYWPFARGNHRWPVYSRHKGQWCGALMFSLICAWINGWANKRDIGNLGRHRAHYDVTVMEHYMISHIRNDIFITDYFLNLNTWPADKYTSGRRFDHNTFRCVFWCKPKSNGIP